MLEHEFAPLYTILWTNKKQVPAAAVSFIVLNNFDRCCCFLISLNNFGMINEQSVDLKFG